jgi:hypothetical protein
MTRVLHQAILGTLNVAGMKNTSAELWQSFSKREWEHALEWMDLSGLAVYFADRLRPANGLSSLPATVRGDLEKRCSANVARTDAILREFKLLTEAFGNARLNYAVLKGIALVPDYCRDPALRTQYDHDIFVDDPSLNAAEMALQRAGYRRKNGREGEAEVVYRRPEPQLRFARTSEGLYSPDLNRSVEIHLTLWESHEEKIQVNLSDDFLARRVTRYWNGVEFPALCDEDSLLFQVLHAFKHILRNWCRLSIFHEIGHFLQRRGSDGDFWDRFAGRIETLMWAPEATLVVFTLAERLFGATVPHRLQEMLNTAHAPAIRLWVERYGQQAALNNFHGSKCSLFLHEEFVESRMDWALIRRKRLFPIQRPHRPPAVVFQRGFSIAGRLWMENLHVMKRLMFHSKAGFSYLLEYPRWTLLRRLRRANYV